MTRVRPKQMPELYTFEDSLDRMENWRVSLQN